MNQTAAPPPRPSADMTQRLGIGSGGRGFWTKRKIWAVSAIAVLVIGGGLYWHFRGTQEPGYLTAKIARGDLVITVGATGTLQPSEKVDVGAEISGRIDSIAVDFNDHVTKGQILAVLDTEQARARLAQSQASLASAKANVAQSQATLAQTKSRTERARGLFQRQAIAAQDLETAEADLQRANANLQKANADQALAAAQLASDQTTLNKAVIRSPIDGVVLNRAVEPGQAVAASLQTPVMFTLASDLTQMELQIDIDEADIGLVHEGQTASFTVDAFPDRRFDAKLVSLHNAPKTANGVVTYQGVLLVDNSSKLLRPGLTAMADLLVGRVNNVLLMPNAALRFIPADRIANAAPPLPKAANGERIGRVWMLQGLKLSPRIVKVGRSDGTNTEVLSGDVMAGENVVTDTKTVIPAP